MYIKREGKQKKTCFFFGFKKNIVILHLNNNKG